MCQCMYAVAMKACVAVPHTLHAGYICNSTGWVVNPAKLLDLRRYWVLTRKEVGWTNPTF